MKSWNKVLNKVYASQANDVAETQDKARKLVSKKTERSLRQNDSDRSKPNWSDFGANLSTTNTFISITLFLQSDL